MTEPCGAQVWAEVAVDGVVRVKVTGELARPLDSAAAAQLMALLDQPGPVLELDLSGLRFCDVAGLRILLRLQQGAIAAGGLARVVAATPVVRLLLEVTETASLFGYPPRSDSASDSDTAD